MSPTHDTAPQGDLLSLLQSSFGDLDTFKEKFSTTALSRFGSGWVWLVYKNGSFEITDTPNQDTPLMDSTPAVLGLDVWEHAYYLKYQNKRADYISAWWHVVNWDQVNTNFSSLLSSNH
jgi:Fe-Mn family superoxide dismutase